jgi:WD40 repeat protein
VERNFPGIASAPWAAAFSPDGTEIAVGACAAAAGMQLCAQGEVSVWSADSGTLIKRLHTANDQTTLFSLAYSPDGTLIASGSCLILDGRCQRGVITLWNTITDEQIAVLNGHRDVVMDLAFTSDSRYLVSSGCGGTDENTVCNAGEVIVWDMETLSPVQTLRGHTSPIFSMTLSSDDRTLITGGEDETLLSSGICPRGQMLGSCAVTQGQCWQSSLVLMTDL